MFNIKMWSGLSSKVLTTVPNYNKHIIPVSNTNYISTEFNGNESIGSKHWVMLYQLQHRLHEVLWDIMGWLWMMNSKAHLWLWWGPEFWKAKDTLIRILIGRELDMPYLGHASLFPVTGKLPIDYKCDAISLQKVLHMWYVFCVLMSILCQGCHLLPA